MRRRGDVRPRAAHQDSKRRHMSPMPGDPYEPTWRM
jgi:hypothetical protein